MVKTYNGGMRRAAFIVSLFVAAAGFTAPWMFPREGFDNALRASFWSAALWGFFVVAGLVRYRVRGLWLILGAPLALFWPASLLLAVLACAQGGACL